MLGAVLATALAVTAACSSDGEPAPTPTPTQPAPTATAVASPTPDPLRDREASGERALAHVRALSVEIGPRVAGTDGERAAVAYIRSELERYGYDVTTPGFPFDASAFLPARVDVGGEAYGGFAFNGSAATNATGRLLYAGIGRPDEFPAGMQGAIALIERGELRVQEKVDNAVAAGAAGVIIYNNEDGGLAAESNAPVPVIGLEREAGATLRTLTTADQVRATISVTPRQGTAYDVVARPRGIDRCATVSGGHFDTVPVTGGANDNASGTAAVLELARVVAANGEQGANCFVLFGAEEYGLVGSREYVRQLADVERSGLRAMLNLDVVGLDAPLVLIGSDDMIETARLAGQAVGIDAQRGEVPNGAGSDYASFLDAGIPTIFFYRNDPLIHTPQDAIDRISPQALEETVRIAFATLLAVND